MAKPHWYAIAEGDLGLHEQRDTDEIRALGAKVGMARNWSPIKTPWCDIWVDSVMQRAGLHFTETKLARSWLKWTGGELITDPNRLRLGDIVVLSRGTSTWQGHVGFFVGRENGRIKLLGGNQNNQVNISAYAENRFLGARRPLGEVAKPVLLPAEDNKVANGPDFGFALAWILDKEKGWSNHPKDPGRATMWGITLATYSSWRQLQGLGSATARQLANIAPSDVGRIYQDLYWRAAKCHLLPAGLALAVFDVAVNKGPGRAIRFLQLALRVTSDGAFGPETLAALKRSDPGPVLVEFEARNMRHYGDLGTFKTFGLGWSRRLVSTAIAAYWRMGTPPLARPELPPEFGEDAPAPEIPQEFPDEPVPASSSLFGPFARQAINLAFKVLPKLFPDSQAIALLLQLRNALQKGT